MSYEAYGGLARAAARKYNIDPDVFLRQITQESGWDEDVVRGRRVSPAGALGIAQFMPRTAESLGVNPLDPASALDGAARYMRGFLDTYKGNYRTALAAYNAGPGNVAKYGGVPPFAETQRYVSNILGGNTEGSAPAREVEVAPINEEFYRAWGELTQLQAQKAHLMDELPVQQQAAIAAANKALASGESTGLKLTPDGKVDIAALLGLNGGGASGGVGTIQTAITFLDKQIHDKEDELYSISPPLAMQGIPGAFSRNADAIKKQQELLGGNAKQVAPLQYTFQIGPKGQIIRTGNNGEWSIVKTDPELADKKVQIQTDKATGEGWAITLDADGNVTNRKSLGIIDYPAVDPTKEYQFKVMTQAASAEQAMAGINLQQRGQVLAAIASDFEHQVSIGQMTYTEANTNLARIDSAFTQRRLDREQALKYAVTALSIHRDAQGNEVTRLPFAEQLSGILSSATGRGFTPDQFDLSVTHVNPEATGQAVLDASAYTSPIPGLVAGAQAARAATNAVVGAPAGDLSVTRQLAAMATSKV